MQERLGSHSKSKRRGRLVGRAAARSGASDKTGMLAPRQRQLIRTLWESGPLSRWELHQRTGLTPNGVGVIADDLLKRGLLRELQPESSTKRAGRPRVPLEIDPGTRHILGMAIKPGQVETQRLSLTGNPIGDVVAKAVSDPAHLVEAAADLLGLSIAARPLAIGITVTGFVDPIARAILFSSALPGRPSTSLDPVYAAAGHHPIILENDMHAIAARWSLENRAGASEDVMLVRISDGQLGAALLIEGRPNRGCATGGNELGHTRFPDVPTTRCYCGQTGCLERIVSTSFLRQRDAHHPPLPDTLAAYSPGADDAADALLRHLAHGLANAVNFIRPHRLVLVSPFVGHSAFIDELLRQTRELILIQLRDRVRIDLWDDPPVGGARTAAWLALAQVLTGRWGEGGGKDEG